MLGVVDHTERTAYGLHSTRIKATSSMKEIMEQLKTQANPLLAISNTLLLDGWYAKNDFIHLSTKLGFDVITKLRLDANLRYLYEGEYAGKGAPRDRWVRR